MIRKHTAESQNKFLCATDKKVKHTHPFTDNMNCNDLTAKKGQDISVKTVVRLNVT